jgi:hypothetical protein
VGGEGGAAAAVEASTTTVRTVITGAGGADGGDPAALTDARAALLDTFAGVTLDAQAQAAITAALEACAARRAEDEKLLERGGDDAADVLEDDLGEAFIRIGEQQTPYRGVVEPVMGMEEWVDWEEERQD